MLSVTEARLDRRSAPIRAVRWRWRAFITAVILVIAANAGAVDRLALGDVLHTAQTDNPEIRAADARYRAMLERPIQERTLPDPTIGVRWHNEDFNRITLGKSEFSFVEFAAEQEVPFPGKLGLRGQIAEQEAAREHAMRDVTELMVLARVVVAYADLAVAERSRDILTETGRTLDLMIEQTQTSYAVGTATQQDALRATLERGGLSERLTMIEQKRDAASATLNGLLARPADTPLPPSEWFPAPPTPRELGALTAKVASASPELRAAREDALRADTALRLARREYLPDFALMGAYMNKDGLAPEWEVGMRVRVPLYFWRRQGPAVAEAAFAREAAERSARNAKLTLDARLRELHSMSEAAYRLVQLYHERLIPQARLTLESARSSYVVGKVDFLSTLNAFTALLEYQLREAEETGNSYKARAETGPLVGESPSSWEVAR